MAHPRITPRLFAKCLLPLAAAYGVAASSPVWAQASAADQSQSWQYELTPYLWFPGTKGDSQVGGSPQIHIDESPSDALKKLDFGLMGTFEARKNRWGVIVDGFHVRLSETGTVSQTVNGAPVVVNGKIGLTQTIFSTAGFYRVSERPAEDAPAVDLVAGLRNMNFKINAELSAASQGQVLLTANPENARSWWDPYMGVRFTVPVAPRWSVLGYADVGGFGVGSQSAWQVQASAKYDWTKSVSTSFGYRTQYINYDDSGFKAKLDFSGLYFGLGYKF
jgi:opacity protein-like surface antigen